jgi:hypothetical protein
MSGGVEAVRAALVANAALLALVPAARIIGDDALEQGITLPAILLSSVSTVDRNLMNPGVNRFVRERVQVTIFAKTRPSRKAVLAAVRKAAADKIGTSVSGLSNVTIHTDGAGPDFLGENDVRITTQDFAVTYSETR